jgi:hypothetical protein
MRNPIFEKRFLSPSTVRKGRKTKLIVLNKYERETVLINFFLALLMLRLMWKPFNGITLKQRHTEIPITD